MRREKRNFASLAEKGGSKICSGQGNRGQLPSGKVGLDLVGVYGRREGDVGYSKRGYASEKKSRASNWSKSLTLMTGGSQKEGKVIEV